MFAAVAVVGWVVLNRTTYGRRTLALGGNPEAARLAGINTRVHTVSLYALSGLCAGIGAIMIASQTTSGSSTNGDGYELNAIAAVIIGGTLLAGGSGTLVGSVLGVLVFTTISNLLIQNNLQTECPKHRHRRDHRARCVAPTARQGGSRLAGRPGHARARGRPSQPEMRATPPELAKSLTQSECDGARPLHQRTS